MKRWMMNLALVLVLLLASVGDACPMCKDSIPDNDATQAAGVPGGFNFSVYYMLVSVFAMMGFVGFIIVKGIRSTSVTLTVPHNSSGSAAPPSGSSPGETASP
jgi:hypothetical protein